jgi:hypothetical protein
MEAQLGLPSYDPIFEQTGCSVTNATEKAWLIAGCQMQSAGQTCAGAFAYTPVPDGINWAFQASNPADPSKVPCAASYTYLGTTFRRPCAINHS